MSVTYHTGPLPPISSLGGSPIKMEQPEHLSRKPHLPSLSTTSSNMANSTSPYSVPPPNHSSATPANSIPSVAFLTSPVDPRKSYSEEKDSAGHQARLSLPSISEALANGPSQAPASASSSHHSYAQPSPRSPHFTWKAANADASQAAHDRGPAQEHQLGRAPYMGHIAPATPETQTAYLPRSYSPRSVPIENHSIRASEPQGSYLRSQPPPQPSPHSARSSQQWPPPPPAPYDAYSRIPEPSNPQYAYHQYPPHSYAPPPPLPAGATNAGYGSNGEVPAWRPENGDVRQADQLRKRDSYGESVKMHLDVFDLESSLNEIASSSHTLLEFGQHYGQRAHQTQKSGPLPGSTPNLMEIDEMIKNAGRISDSLVRLREVVVSQQAALAERSKEQGLNKGGKHAVSDDGPDVSRDGYGGSDPKKRRGRAAPPGRCHSCNRAETPEWRRGPDGARTLCNACGLHYAKLTRKMGANKQPLGSSNLRPKSIGSSSPKM